MSALSALRRSGAPSPAGPNGAGRRGAFAAGWLAALLCVLPAAPGVERAHAQGTLSAIEADVDQIARRARPSLVTVIAQRDLPAAKGSPASAHRTHNRVGSGVAVGDDEILTTASVLLGANHVIVLTDNGLQVEAAIVGLDPIYNVAVLRAQGLMLTPLPFAQRPAQMGDWVIALGSSYRAAPTQSVGNVAYRFREPRMSLLQLTNEVYPGNSGGAAINSRGELVGLVQGELGAPEAPGRKDDAERRPGGMSFVIPVEDVLPVYESIQREGRVRHGFFGVSTRAAFVDSDTQPGLRVPIGAIVETVQLGGPAARLGLQKGDLIVAFDNERIEYPEQLARWVAAAKPGTEIKLVWAHNEMQRVGRVTLDESPQIIPSWMQIEPPTAPVASAGAGANHPRIAELQEQIRRLNRELDRLRNPQDSTR